MSGFAGLDDVIAKATGSNERDPLFLWRGDLIAGVALSSPAAVGVPSSLWEVDGSPSAGTTPGVVTIPDNTTVGGFMQADPGGGRQLWITGAFCGAGATGGSVVIYDRLLHIGGLSGSTPSAQAVGGVITRYTGADSYENECWIEVSQAVGVTSRSYTMNYVDETGTAQVSQAGPGTYPFVGAALGLGVTARTRMQQMPCAPGTSGVRSVTNLTLSGSTGGVGSLSVLIMRPLLVIPMSGIGGGGSVDMIEAIVEVKPGACLAAYYWSNTTVLPRGFIQLAMVES